MAEVMIRPPESLERSDEGQMGQRALMFGRQGLSRMCDFITFSELKMLRHICHTWNDVCATHGRFHRAHGIFGVGWDRDSEGLQQTQLRTWKKVTLNHFAVHESKIFRTYFGCTAPKLKILTLDQLKVTCTQLSQMLNSCVSLETITFNQVAFTRQNVVVEADNNNPAPQQPHGHVGHGQGQPPNDISQPRYSICCPHTEFAPNGPQPIPTLKFIKISKQSSFPLCILDILAKRSVGILEKLTLEFIDPAVRQAHHHGQVQPIHEARPNMTQIQPYIRQICQGSSGTIKQFKWLQNGGQEHQTQILTQQFPAMEKFTFDEFWGHGDELRVPTLNFLRAHLQLIELDLSVRLTNPLSAELPPLLTTMTQLRKFRLQIDSQAHNANNVNIFQNLGQLVEVEVADRIFGAHHHFHHGGGLNSIYLSHLPLSVQKLTCNHRVEPNVFTTAILTPTYVLMSKLVIKNGRFVNDAIMQLLIIHVTQLQELTIMNADHLTDAGLTGIALASCRQMNRCHSQALLLKPPRQTTEIRRSINEFVYMRELDFSGCSKLSDISICYGVRFPELKIVTLDACNVSDISLVSLGTHNPKLETLNIKRNRRISCVGLNRLIEISKSIRNVRTTKIIAGRLMTSEVSGHKEHPHFNDVVQTTPFQIQDDQ